MPDETNTAAPPPEPTLAEKAAAGEKKLPPHEWPTFAIVVDGKIVNHDRNDPKFWSPPEGAKAIDITGHEREIEAMIGQPWPPRALTPAESAARDAQFAANEAEFAAAAAEGRPPVIPAPVPTAAAA